MMGESVVEIDLFVEDRAHEAFIGAVIRRIAREMEKTVRMCMRSARGGHGRAITELKLYQRSILKSGGFLRMPDLIFVAIDANCKSFNAAKKEITENIEELFADRSVIACPDPHIERWYLADVKSFARVVGRQPGTSRRKCERDVYKSLLASTIAEAGHPPTLGGIEFAEELVNDMDFYRAGKAERSFQHFINDAVSRIKSA
ncbi:hypothetical protein QUF80_12295 [Desulfococcaceae bacterium HSG8]|nr:hypothetical protein [Desulfococcaceae bacterium HSG8]